MENLFLQMGKSFWQVGKLISRVIKSFWQVGKFDLAFDKIICQVGKLFLQVGKLFWQVGKLFCHVGELFWQVESDYPAKRSKMKKSPRLIISRTGHLPTIQPSYIKVWCA